MLEEKLNISSSRIRDTSRSEDAYFTRHDNERSKSRESALFNRTGRKGETLQKGSNLSQMDQTKTRLEILIKKINIMANELTKIYQSLQNCVVIIQDWRANSTEYEAEQLRLLLKKAQASVNNSSLQYMGTVFKVKDDANRLCMEWSHQMNQLCTRLEAISGDCKDEITRKATDLIAIKSEMDNYDPFKRIPANLKSYMSRSQM